MPIALAQMAPPTPCKSKMDLVRARWTVRL